MKFQPGNGQFLPRFGPGFGQDFGQVFGEDLGQIFGQDFSGAAGIANFKGVFLGLIFLYPTDDKSSRNVLAINDRCGLLPSPTLLHFFCSTPPMASSPRYASYGAAPTTSPVRHVATLV